MSFPIPSMEQYGSSEEEQRINFFSKLSQLLASHNLSLDSIYKIGLAPIDLFLLFHEVIKRGGIDRVTTMQLNDIGTFFNFPTNENSASILLSIFRTYLSEFEKKIHFHSDSYPFSDPSIQSTLIHNVHLSSFLSTPSGIRGLIRGLESARFDEILSSLSQLLNLTSKIDSDNSFLLINNLELIDALLDLISFFSFFSSHTSNKSSLKNDHSSLFNDCIFSILVIFRNLSLLSNNIESLLNSFRFLLFISNIASGINNPNVLMIKISAETLAEISSFLDLNKYSDSFSKELINIPLKWIKYNNCNLIFNTFRFISNLSSITNNQNAIARNLDSYLLKYIIVLINHSNRTLSNQALLSANVLYQFSGSLLSDRVINETDIIDRLLAFLSSLGDQTLNATTAAYLLVEIYNKCSDVDQKMKIRSYSIDILDNATNNVELNTIEILYPILDFSYLF